MRKLALAAVAVGTISAASVAPVEARWGGGWRGGPGIGFGLAAGALAFGAAAASPYYYGSGYYGPGYYGPGPYAYGGPVYYGPRYYRPYYRPYDYW